MYHQMIAPWLLQSLNVSLLIFTKVEDHHKPHRSELSSEQGWNYPTNSQFDALSLLFNYCR